jgi:streptogramin lyase
MPSNDSPEIVEFGPTFRSQLGRIALASDGTVWVQDGDGAASIDRDGRIVEIPQIDNCDATTIEKLPRIAGEAWMNDDDRLLEFRGPCIISREILPDDAGSYVGFLATRDAVYYSTSAQLGITRLAPDGTTTNLYASTGNVTGIFAGSGYIWMERSPDRFTVVEPGGQPHDVKFPRAVAGQERGTHYAVAADGSLVFDLLVSATNPYQTPETSIVEKISPSGGVSTIGSVARPYYADVIAAIVTTPDGSIWTTEPNLNHLVRFAPDGTAHLIRNGLPMGAQPSLMVTDTATESCVWVTDLWGASVYHVCADGSIRQIGNGLSPITEYDAPYPQADGTVIFHESLGWHPRTAYIDTEGTIHEEPRRPESTPTQSVLTFRMVRPGRDGKPHLVTFSNASYNDVPESGTPLLGPDGNMWSIAATGDAIVRVDARGRRKAFRKGLTRYNSGPQYLTRGPDGALWFTEVRSRVGRIAMDGTIREFSAGIPRRSFLGGIVTGCDGNLWFTMYHGNELARITPAGVVTRFRNGIFPSRGNDTNVPDSIPAVDRQGRIWFNEPQGGRIARATIACRR